MCCRYFIQNIHNCETNNVVNDVNSDMSIINNSNNNNGKGLQLPVSLNLQATNSQQQQQQSHGMKTPPGVFANSTSPVNNNNNNNSMNGGSNTIRNLLAMNSSTFTSSLATLSPRSSSPQNVAALMTSNNSNSNNSNKTSVSPSMSLPISMHFLYLLTKCSLKN